MGDERFAREKPNPVPLDSLKIPEWDIREGRDEDDIRNIAQSMAAEAQMMPILLGRKDGHIYEIVDGVHRYLAAKRLGWPDMDCMRLEADVEDQTAAALSNLGRVVMSPTDTHQVIDYYLQNTDYAHSQVAEKLGVHASTVTRHGKISKGHNEIQSAYMRGDVPLKAAAALAQVPDRDAALSIMNDADRLGLNQGEIKAMAANATVRIKREQDRTTGPRTSPTEQVRREVTEKIKETEAEMESDLGKALAKQSATAAENRPDEPPEPPDGQPPGQPPDELGTDTQPPAQSAQQMDVDTICSVCGTDYEPHEKATFILPEMIQNELGLRQVELCASCAQQVYQGIQALQDSASEEAA